MQKMDLAWITGFTAPISITHVFWTFLWTDIQPQIHVRWAKYDGIRVGILLGAWLKCWFSFMGYYKTQFFTSNEGGFPIPSIVYVGQEI